jgi:hypothetical protein
MTHRHPLVRRLRWTLVVGAMLAFAGAAPAQTITIGNGSQVGGHHPYDGYPLGVTYVYSLKDLIGFDQHDEPIYHYQHGFTWIDFTTPAQAASLDSFSIWLLSDLFWINRVFVSLLQSTTGTFAEVMAPVTVGETGFHRYDFAVGGLATRPGDIFRIFVDAGDPYAPGFPVTGISTDGAGMYLVTSDGDPLYEATFTAAPEPATVLLVLSGLVGMVLIGRRRSARVPGPMQT